MNARSIRARIWLCQAERADDSLVEHLRDKLLPLLLRAKFLDEGGKAVGQQGIGSAVGEAGLGQLLNDNHFTDGIVSGSAVFFTMVHPQQSQFGHFLPGLHGKPVGFIQIRSLRLAVSRRELRRCFS